VDILWELYERVLWVVEYWRVFYMYGALRRDGWTILLDVCGFDTLLCSTQFT